MKVLVVDDNVTYLTQMQKYLSLHSLQVQTAESGKKSLELMGEQKYDVVILDLKMPDISGIDVLEWAKKQGISSQFIVITGYGRVDTAVKSMKMGAVDYLQKPFDPEILLNLIYKISENPSQVRPLLKPFPRINSTQIMQKVCKGKTILVVTGQNVSNFSQTYSLNPDCTIVLSIHNSPDTFDAKKIVDLQHEIKKFISYQPHPLVIHGGLSVLLEIHSPPKIQDYLLNLHAHIQGTNSQLIMLYDSPQEKNFLENLENLAPSTFIDDVVKIFDHSARCVILNLLARHESLHYSDFLKKMDIDISSNLAFHLKRLVALKLIDKKDGRYTLTDRGKYFVDILFSLALGKYSDPTSNVIYCPVPQH